MFRKMIGAAVTAALVFAIPVPSHADEFPATPATQDFNGGAAGWDADVAYDGLCLPSLLCATAAPEWAAGGADGNGYIRTRFGSVATTVAGTSTSTWTSPSFTYHGLAGKTPAKVTFDMSVLKQMGALLGLSVLNSASYQVDVVDTNGNAVNVVPATAVEPADVTWSAIPSASINPNALKLGRTYAIRITTTYNTAVAVVETGLVGFDNVRLTTYDKDGGNGSTNGGSGITSAKQLRILTKTYILPASAKVSGRLLKVKLRCPAIATPKPCKIQLQGLQAGKFSKPATARKIITIKAGKSRTVKIRIKPAYVAKYHAAKKIWVKSVVRVGKIRVTVRKRVKLK